MRFRRFAVVALIAALLLGGAAFARPNIFIPGTVVDVFNANLADYLGLLDEHEDEVRLYEVVDQDGVAVYMNDSDSLQVFLAWNTPSARPGMMVLVNRESSLKSLPIAAFARAVQDCLVYQEDWSFLHWAVDAIPGSSYSCYAFDARYEEAEDGYMALYIEDAM